MDNNEKDYIIKAQSTDENSIRVSFDGTAVSIYTSLSAIVTSMIEDLKLSPDFIIDVISTAIANSTTTEGSETK